jgi:hypothetical protein
MNGGSTSQRLYLLFSNTKSCIVGMDLGSRPTLLLLHTDVHSVCLVACKILVFNGTEMIIIALLVQKYCA